MRLSANKNDPGYNPRWAYKACPYLNGKLVDKVVTVDEENRIIIRHATDAHGNVIVDLEKGEILKEWMHGEVCLRIVRKNGKCPEGN